MHLQTQIQTLRKTGYEKTWTLTDRKGEGREGRDWESCREIPKGKQRQGAEEK